MAGTGVHRLARARIPGVLDVGCPPVLAWLPAPVAREPVGEFALFRSQLRAIEKRGRVHTDRPPRLSIERPEGLPERL